jgi:hypothetical protein
MLQAASSQGSSRSKSNDVRDFMIVNRGNVEKKRGGHQQGIGFFRGTIVTQRPRGAYLCSNSAFPSWEPIPSRAQFADPSLHPV